MRFVGLMVLAFFIAGCATTSGTKNLSRESLAMIVEGKTTKEEVRQLLGEPSSKVVMTNSEQSYPGVDLSKTIPHEIWSYVKLVEDARSGLGLAPMQTTTLSVNFDKSGVVQSYTMIETA